MSEKETYNGWTNYATWRIMLEMFNGMEFTELDSYDIYELSIHLKEMVIEVLEQTGSGLTLDYALAFVDYVNFYEIAESIKETYKN